MPHHLFRVSVKAAIFNDKNELLMIHMDDRATMDYGLPGGHIDEGEQPIDAMLRELAEETGVKDYSLRPADFFLHEEGKVILAYTGKTANAALKSAQNNHEGKPVWVSRKQFATISTNQCYIKFALKNWPANSPG